MRWFCDGILRGGAGLWVILQIQSSFLKIALPVVNPMHSQALCTAGPTLFYVTALQTTSRSTTQFEKLQPICEASLM